MRKESLTRSSRHKLSRVERHKEERFENFIKAIAAFTGTLLQRLLVAIIIAMLTALLL